MTKRGMTNMKPEQRLLNGAVALMRKQGKPSMNEDRSCRYTNDEGCHCAFWPAIANPKHPAVVQNRPAGYLVSQVKHALHPWARSLKESFAQGVQGCHDDAAYDWGDSPDKEFTIAFERNAKVLAEEYNLDYPD